MIDPNNVLIRCPNGHELQALKTDLDKPLACPVCNVTFTPGRSPPTPPLGPGVGGPPTEAMTYASSTLTEPVAYPAYTSWMLGAWVLYTVIAALTAIYTALTQPATGASSAAAAGTMLVGCVTAMVGLAAIVMHLMWIHRIHKDAKEGGYQGVSPGLALGLSFLPVFNYAWAGWTMKKLAGFIASGERESDPDARKAVDATTLCFVMGTLMALSVCVVFGMVGTTVIQLVMEMTSSGVEPGSPEWQQKLQGAGQQPAWLTIIYHVIQVAAVFIYFSAVRKLEASLYPFLGAPPR
ncbi:MAG: hypothetical protein MI923_11360 [Phycisphaerales bacterium]|nr:hypothetical protein [Phycisphaerales bacterium]